MRIIYYLKNLKNLPQEVIDFLRKKSIKFEKIEKQEGESILEVELTKSKEKKGKSGLYKVKVIFDTPKRAALVFWGFGKNIYQAINDAFRKLSRSLKR